MRFFRDFFDGFWDGINDFGTNISTLVNSILLLVVYIVGVGITSIFAKIVGKRFLETKRFKKGTYWHELNLKKKESKEYYRQF